MFVSPQPRRDGARDRDACAPCWRGGDNLILFPEGTTSDGSRVLPFRSSFLALAEGDGAPPIQPVSVVYDRLAGLPTGRATRPLFAWYGDMDIASHYWRFAQPSRAAGQRAAAPAARPARLPGPQGAGAGGLEGGRRRRGDAAAEPPGRPIGTPPPATLAGADQPAGAGMRRG